MVLIVGSIVFFSQCLHFKSNQDPIGKAFVGSGECQSCHPEIFEDYLHDPHHLSVRPAGLTSIAVSFSKNSNSFII
ncbi:MAG TPA: hypothetical protein VFV08_04805, partial [Puia sp.]|nr:hypothetical protein [Puia sp.]